MFVHDGVYAVDRMEKTGTPLLLSSKGSKILRWSSIAEEDDYTEGTSHLWTDEGTLR